MLGDIIIKVSKLKLVFMKTFRYQSFLELGKFNFEEMIWYLSIKHNKPLSTSGLYTPALSLCIHTRFLSVFACSFSHSKLDSSVALRLLSYLNELLCL